MPHWAEYWPERDPHELAADVRTRFEAALEAWRLSDPRPFPSGAVALVCEVAGAEGPLALKVNPGGHRDVPWLVGEGEALRFWEPTGAVARLLGTRDDGLTLLMERLLPGTALDDTGRPFEERLEMLGGLAAELHRHVPDRGGYISLSDFLADGRAALADRPELLDEIDELLRPGDDDVLLHADLHGGNVLRHGDRWKVIDPKGVRGDRHADIWALIEPDAPALPEPRAAWTRVTRYAEAAGMDAQRAGAWTRVRAYMEAAQVTDAGWAARLRDLGAALS
jgi:streptomycin 6-kinase